MIRFTYVTAKIEIGTIGLHKVANSTFPRSSFRSFSRPTARQHGKQRQNSLHDRNRWRQSILWLNLALEQPSFEFNWHCGRKLWPFHVVVPAPNMSVYNEEASGLLLNDVIKHKPIYFSTDKQSCSAKHPPRLPNRGLSKPPPGSLTARMPTAP